MTGQSAALVDELYRAARVAALPPWLADDDGTPPVLTWADLLFRTVTGDDAGGGPGQGHTSALSDPAEKSQALLAAVLARHEQLLDHLDTLPERARDWYVRSRLGLDRLPSVPDVVAVVAEGDPKRLPAVLPAGTALKAGKNLLGEDRMYETALPLTVLGTAVRGLRAHDASPGLDTVARVDGPPAARFEAFPGEGFTAPRDFVLFSPLLRFDWHTTSDVAVVLLRLTAADHWKVLGDLEWWYSGAEGDWPADVTELGTSGAGDAIVQLSMGGVRGQSCVPATFGGRTGCYLRAGVPEDAEVRAAAPGISFLDARISVHRDDVVPDGAAYNGGQLDVKKEFQPFGPVPRRGDSFSVHSDEAFSKALGYFKITLEEVAGPGQVAAPVVYPTPVRSAVEEYLEGLTDTERAAFFGSDEAEQAFADAISDFASEVEAHGPRLEWQRWDGRAWTAMRDPVSRLASVEGNPGVAAGTPTSEPVDLAGVVGHHVRVVLQEGDFGWERYLTNLATLAAKAAGANVAAPSASDLTPPPPPVTGTVRLGYSTLPEPPQDLVTRNGLEVARPAGPGRIHPFVQRPFASQGGSAQGVLVVGLDLDDRHLGSQVSLALGVDGASACDPFDEDSAITWQYRAATGGWSALPVVDGTRSLRQSGILRFVAPPDWAQGAPELEEPVGRWARALVPDPAMAGAPTWVLPDAVEARYRLSPTRGEDDPTPAQPLPGGGVKGLVTPVSGIKKVTNPTPSTGGRAAEPRSELFPRTGRWLRHRNRAVTALDVEDLVRAGFPEVALVRCLPHTSWVSSDAPGWISVVVVPDTADDQPLPSVDLADRIGTALREVGTPHLRVAVRCPEYVAVRVEARVALRPGFVAAEARTDLAELLDDHLHPLRGGRGPDPFGRPLFRSDLVRLLEADPAVDFVEDLRIVEPADAPERVDADPCRGVVVSSGRHSVVAREVL